MRSVLLALTALAMSTPALAADKPSKSTRELEKMAATLNNPIAQDAMAGALNGIIGSLLDLKVDGFVKALEPLNKGKKIKMKGSTLREMAISEDRHFEKKLDAGTHTLVAGVGALTSALAQMAPQLEKAMENIDDVIEQVEDKLPAIK